MRIRTFTAIAVAIVMCVPLLAACGDDGDEGAGPGTKASPKGQAFMRAMLPHHQMAIEMAEMAEERATKAEVREMAKEMVDAQGAEIEQLNAIYRRLFDGQLLTPDPRAAGRLGLTPEEAATNMGEDDMRMLERARPFDREFIDLMVEHHAGAIRMAQAVLPSTRDPGLRKLAQGIVISQSREIEMMNRWRAQWYGGPSPAGGVPLAS